MNICMALGSHFEFAKGGAEIQADLLSNYMINKGHHINYIRQGKENSEVPVKHKKNYRIYKVKKPFLSNNAFVYKNKKFLYNLLDEIDPDVIYQRGIHFADLISSYGEQKDIPVISGISQNDLCSKNKISFEPKGALNLINNFIKQRYYQKSRMIISQTEKQKRLLKKNFGVDSVVIPNGHKVPKKSNVKKTNPPIVSWIANIKKWKQPEIFLELAKELKNVNARFVYCGRPSSDENYQDKIIRETDELSNIEYLGEVPFEKTNELLSKSSIFVNTSASFSNQEYGRTEGFPNTYIQAWMRETPVVALNFDPDGIMKEKKMGVHSGNFEKLVEDVRYLLENEDVREKMGKRARRHAVENYDIEKIGERYLEIFEKHVKNK